MVVSGLSASFLKDGIQKHDVDNAVDVVGDPTPTVLHDDPSSWSPPSWRSQSRVGQRLAEVVAGALPPLALPGLTSGSCARYHCRFYEHLKGRVIACWSTED